MSWAAVEYWSSHGNEGKSGNSFTHSQSSFFFKCWKIGHFQLLKTLTLRTRLSAKLVKMGFICMKMKIIFKSVGLHSALHNVKVLDQNKFQSVLKGSHGCKRFHSFYLKNAWLRLDVVIFIIYNLSNFLEICGNMKML